MKKIIFVTASTKGGGAERMLFNIINSVSSSFSKLLIVTSCETVPESIGFSSPVINLNKKHASFAFLDLIKRIKQEQPDILFTTSSNIGYQLVLAKKLFSPKSKVIIRCAVTPSEIVHTKPFREYFLNKLIKWTYAYSDLIIAQTNYMKQDLADSYNISPEKICVIRNIVDVQKLDYLSNEASGIPFLADHYNIVAAGALYSIKGFDLLIIAMSRLLQKIDSNVKLWILGDERYEKGYKSYLKSLILQYELSDVVTLVGHKDNPYPFLKKADLFVMSSRKEGFPNVVLESLFLGTPVLATNCVDFSSVIINGVNGYVVEKEDVDALANGIKLSMSTRFNVDQVHLDNFDYNSFFLRLTNNV